MPGREETRKQHALGGIAGLALLAFALVYRFFPGVLQVVPQEEIPSVTTVASQTPAATWSAVEAPPATTAAVPADGEAGTTFEQALRMGPPLPTPKEVALLLERARDAESRGALFEPAGANAVALYREALSITPDNAEAELGLERIAAALRDWTLAAVERGDKATAERYLAEYEQLPHRSRDLDRLRERVAVLDEVLPLLARAAGQMRAGNLVEPEGDNALASWRQVLELDPGNQLADAGLAAIERGFLEQALVEAARDEFAAADDSLAEAGRIRPGSPELLETRSRIEGLRRQRAESVLAQARSALDSGDADLAEQLAARAQEISPDLTGLDTFAEQLVNARLYASYAPGEVIRDRFLDISGQAPPMVVLPTGSFMMGSPEDEEGHLGSESPQRRVRIGLGFALGQAEVTVAEFGEFVAASGYVTDAERLGSAAVYEESTGRIAERRGINWRNDYAGARASPDLPVVNVSWNDAAAYASWVAERTGKAYRLPSEAEFEYALRAGSRTRFPWGDGNPSQVLENVTGEGDRSPTRRSWSSAFPRYSDGYWGPAPVRSFPANAYGLYDMGGNVSEWVTDCWHENYLRAPRDSSAWVNPGCERRVVRGGSWGSAPDQVRSAFRLAARADTRSGRVGFRLARTL